MSWPAAPTGPGTHLPYAGGTRACLQMHHPGHQHRFLHPAAQSCRVEPVVSGLQLSVWDCSTRLLVSTGRLPVGCSNVCMLPNVHLPESESLRVRAMLSTYTMSQNWMCKCLTRGKRQRTQDVCNGIKHLEPPMLMPPSTYAPVNHSCWSR
jgi:hypothetical protein